MAKNQKKSAAAIRFGPAFKAFFWCLLIAGSAVGYVWQKSQVHELGQQIRQREIRLAQLQKENQTLSNELSMLQSPVKLDDRARQLNLGLAPAQPLQVVRLPEPAGATPDNENSTRRLAARPLDATQ